MELINITKALIITHIVFGSIALISGTISLTTKKGNSLHKKAGKVFYYTLFVSAALSLTVATMPNHQSPFLFCLGLFSLYFIYGGYRSLKFNKKNISLTVDKIIAYLIIILGIIMILYPIILKNKINFVMLNFGIVSILFGIVDLFLFRDIKRIHKNWLKIHLLKMTSGYIASVTAFVVNQWNLGVLGWFLPAIIGNIYIVYWFYQLNKAR